MKNKIVTHTLPAQKIDMGGFPVKQALPTNNVQQVDPFLLLHHARVKPIYDCPAKIQGVGPHPHRGFSPVTFVIEGEVHHRDSRGNNQVAKSGEVQWIHSGAGIIHSERPSQNLIETKGMQEIIQLWINSPADKKMIEPEYKHIPETEIPRIESEDGLSDVKLISGAYNGVKGKINGQSELLLLWANSKAGANNTFTIPEGFNATVYSVKGDLKVEGHGVVDPESLLVFGDEGNQITIHANSEAQYLVLAGAPIDEPVVQHGPFVMNTQTEIMEAMRDYQMGKMGVLIEED
ncbi:MAG: redox-sensitive bicupin YhaK (pirin superfamily) [Crocinitomicaceae bacterium]|jgi:redox-sensitive bicupin YhaK (pirin superfamily)